MGIFGNSFKSGAFILVILALGQFINVITGSVGYLLMMSGNERLLRNNIIFIAVLNLTLNLLLIPKYGILGAAISTSVSLALQNIISMVIVKYRLGIWTFPLFPRNKEYIAP